MVAGMGRDSPSPLERKRPCGHAPNLHLVRRSPAGQHAQYDLEICVTQEAGKFRVPCLPQADGYYFRVSLLDSTLQGHRDCFVPSCICTESLEQYWAHGRCSINICCMNVHTDFSRYYVSSTRGALCTSQPTHIPPFLKAYLYTFLWNSQFPR